jgi:hypothetical protein
MLRPEAAGLIESRRKFMDMAFFVVTAMSSAVAGGGAGRL